MGRSVRARAPDSSRTCTVSPSRIGVRVDWNCCPGRLVPEPSTSRSSVALSDAHTALSNRRRSPIVGGSPSATRARTHVRGVPNSAGSGSDMLAFWKLFSKGGDSVMERPLDAGHDRELAGLALLEVDPFAGHEELRGGARQRGRRRTRSPQPAAMVRSARLPGHRRRTIPVRVKWAVSSSTASATQS